MPLERRRVLYSGRVQGVGFRATCRWLARGVRVVGYVRNLPDGRVEVLAEGETEEVERFLEAIDRELGGFIRNRDCQPVSPENPPIPDFSVRY